MEFKSHDVAFMFLEAFTIQIDKTFYTSLIENFPMENCNKIKFLYDCFGLGKCVVPTFSD